MFNKVTSPVCLDCQPDEDRDFDAVRTALEARPNAKPEELAEAAGVPLEVVTRMLRQGVLTTAAMAGANVTCGNCGAPAISASKRLCQKCLDKLNLEMARAQASIKLGAKPRPQVDELLHEKIQKKRDY
jgi:hypothetical protein